MFVFTVSIEETKSFGMEDLSGRVFRTVYQSSPQK